MKTVKRIITALFAVMLFAPLCFTAALGMSVKDIPKINEYLSPEMLLDNRGNSSGFFSDTEKYVNEQLPVRNSIIGASSHIQSGLLKSTTSNVIAGKNGYLFSAEELDDCTASNTMSEKELNDIICVLDSIDEYCSDRGVKFAFTVAPNKSSMLKNELPYYIRKSGSPGNYERLKEKLSGRAYFIDLTDGLRGNADMYHKTDTHWNNLGALSAYRSIMQGIGKENYKAYDELEFTKKYCWEGDLTDLLYPDKKPVSDYQYVSELNSSVAKNFEIGIRREQSRFTPPEYLEYITDDRDNKIQDIKTKNRKESGSVIILRDSFARALMPYFIDNFRSCEFVISNGVFNSYRHSIENADYLILEIAERNLNYITDSPQLIEAKSTQAVYADKTVKSPLNTAEIISDFAYYEIRGTLDERLTENGSGITVKLSDGAHSYYYKALPVRNESSESGYFMSSYFNEVPEGSYSVEIIVNGASTGELNKIIINEEGED